MGTSNPAGPVYGLVLAAGQGQRFGGGKLNTVFRGRPLLSHVLTIVQAAQRKGLIRGGHVVIPAADPQAARLVNEAGLEPIRNDAPHLGLSRSLRIGFAALEERSAPAAEAALIFLGDQPLVRLEVVERLVEAWNQDAGEIIRPRYEAGPDRPGHPVLISRLLWPLVHQLEGDAGLRALMHSTLPDGVLLDVVGDNPDVDTRADLHALEIIDPARAVP